MPKSTERRTVPIVRRVICLSVFAQRKEIARQSARTQENPIMTNPTQLIEQLASLLKRYRTETPLGHQPYLIAETVDGVLSEARSHLEQPTEPLQVETGKCKMCEWIKGASLHPKYAADRMAGAGHTCKTQATEPAPSTAGERANELAEQLCNLAEELEITHYVDFMREAAALLQSTALPVGELTDEQIHEGIKALMQCGSSDLESLSPKAYATYQDEVRRVYTAIAAARPQPVLEPMTVEAYTAIALAQPASEPAAVSGWKPIESAPKYLKNGMRFKISGSDSFGGELLGLPQDLIGQWVAFVDATDNTHLPAAPTGEPG